MDYVQDLYDYLIKLPDKYIHKQSIMDKRLMSDRLFNDAWHTLYARKQLRQVPYLQEGEWNYILVIEREGKLKEDWLNEHK